MPAPRSPSVIEIVKDMLDRIRQREEADAPFVLEYSPADGALRPWLWCVDLCNVKLIEYLQCRCDLGLQTNLE